MRADTLGVVLAGGLARRMGGGDKPLRLLGGVPMLDHVLRRITPQVAAMIVNANGDPARFASHGLPVVADGLPDHPGPLAGILAALDWAAEHRPGLPWVVSVPGDAPFIPHDLVARLHAARGGLSLACAPRCSPANVKSTAGPPATAAPMPTGPTSRWTPSSTPMHPTTWPPPRPCCRCCKPPPAPP
jgi:molybdenum cofactor guanylyltransferase